MKKNKNKNKNKESLCKLKTDAEDMSIDDLFINAMEYLLEAQKELISSLMLFQKAAEQDSIAKKKKKKSNKDIA